MHKKQYLRFSLGNEKGMVLVVGLLLMAVLVMLGTVAVMTSTTDIKISGNYKQSERAFYNAEAGIHYVMSKIEDGTITLPTSDTITPSVTAPTNFSFDSVSITYQSANRYLLSVTGHAANSASETIKVIIGYKSYLSYGLFADGDVDLKADSAVYSYNSNSTPNPITTDYPAKSTHSGDVGSNTSITGYNNSYIDGDVALGESSSGTTATYSEQGDPGPIVTEAEGIEVGERVDPDPLGAIGGTLATEFTTYSTSNDNSTTSSTSTPPSTISASNVINLGNGETITLTGKSGGANYYLSDMTLKNGATLNIDASSGPVNIYLTGSLEAKEGSSINLTGKPTEFTIYSNSDSNIVVKNSGEFKGTIYAPYASVTMMNSSNVYGLIWGNEVSIKNSGNFYFDEAIQDNFKSNKLEIVSWLNSRNG